MSPKLALAIAFGVLACASAAPEVKTKPFDAYGIPESVLPMMLVSILTTYCMFSKLFHPTVLCRSVARVNELVGVWGRNCKSLSLIMQSMWVGIA